MKKMYSKPKLELVKEANAPLEKRAGQFALNLHKGIFNNKQHRKELRLIMASCVVVNAVHFQAMNQVNYVVLCEQFKPVEEGEIVPGYIPTFKLDEKGTPIECVWESQEEHNKNMENKN